MVSFGDWVTNAPTFTTTYEVNKLDGWQPFRVLYADGAKNPALERIIEIAADHNVQSVLVETRYIDADWRSEHSRFYSTTYARYPSIAHRAHFFAAPLPSDLSDLSGLETAYKGYTVLRPVPSRPVGRTMIEPPPDLKDGMRCEAIEDVNVLGWPMTVRAMPFISQDAQYMRCAHAAMWMVLRHAYLRGQLARYLPSDIHEATKSGVVMARQVPSEGITRFQMMGGMSQLGLSPTTIELPASKLESGRLGSLGLFGILCRYINSNISPVVFSKTHAWLVVGYTRKTSGAHQSLTLYRHDDNAGPYIRVDDPWNETSKDHKDWTHTVVPLPAKIYMTADRAELIARFWFERWIDQKDTTGVLRGAQDAGKLTYRTYGIDVSQYKSNLNKRQHFDATVAAQYRLSPWPRNLWVVEAIDRRLAWGSPCVLGEVIIDPTANHFPSVGESGQVGIIATHAPGQWLLMTPDTEDKAVGECGYGSYASGRPDLSRRDGRDPLGPTDEAGA